MTKMTIPAWYNEPKLKAAVMARLERHREMDSFRQAFYFDVEEQKGCHIGCLLNKGYQKFGELSYHAYASKLFGLPLNIIYMFEYFFESLPTEVLSEWVLGSTGAIEPGADLEKLPEILRNVLKDDSTFRKHANIIYTNIIKYERYPQFRWADSISGFNVILLFPLMIKALSLCPPVEENGEIPEDVKTELCSAQIWCPQEELIAV